MANNASMITEIDRRYVAMLAEVGDTHSVIVQRDILNVEGETIFLQGEPFDSSMIETLAFADLDEKVDTLFSIENGLSPESLFQQIDEHMCSDASLKALLELNPDSRKTVRDCCDYVCRFPQLQQKLTVYSCVLPDTFQQSFLSAWLGVILMQSMERTSNDVDIIFAAALCHDIGMMFLPSKILNTDSALSAEEWRLLQSHTAVGYDLLRDIDELPKGVARAVWEHHENLDGTGYPRGVVGSVISRYGQILGLLDSLNKVYLKRLKVGQRPIRDLIPVVKMNGHSRFGQAGLRMIEILNRMEEDSECAVPDDLVPQFFSALRDRHRYVSESVSVLKEMATGVGFRHNDPQVFLLQNAIIHISVAASQAGLINDAYIRWLDQVESECLKHAYREAEDVFLMMQEVIYHLNKLKQQLRCFVDVDDSDTLVRGALIDGLRALNAVRAPAINQDLQSLWIVNVG